MALYKISQTTVYVTKSNPKDLNDLLSNGWIMDRGIAEDGAGALFLLYREEPVTKEQEDAAIKDFFGDAFAEVVVPVEEEAKPKKTRVKKAKTASIPVVE